MEKFVEKRLDSAERVFEHMKKVVEAPDALLKYYLEDFYKHDYSLLRYRHVPGQEYVWSIRETGTYFAPIGIHESACDFVKASADPSGGLKKEFYHVTEDGIKEISHDELLRLIIQGAYSINQSKAHQYSDSISQGHVLKSGSSLFDFEIRYSDKEVQDSVDILITTSIDSIANINDKFALQSLTSGRAITLPNGMFTKVMKIDLDGEDLYEALLLNDLEENMESEKAAKPKQ